RRRACLQDRLVLPSPLRVRQPSRLPASRGRRRGMGPAGRCAQAVGLPRREGHGETGLVPGHRVRLGSAAVLVLNFYSPLFIDQLRKGRKTATIRLGDKTHKYRKGEVVLVTVGYQYSPRERIFEAVVDSIEVKRVGDLSPRDIEHDNPEFRRLDEEVNFLEQIYGRSISNDDTVTVVRFSQVFERRPEIAERLSPQAPTQN